MIHGDSYLAILLGESLHFISAFLLAWVALRLILTTFFRGLHPARWSGLFYTSLTLFVLSGGYLLHLWLDSLQPYF